MNERPTDLFFDLDGTLTEAGEGITRCIQHALQTLGEEVPERSSLERFVGPPLADTFRRLLAEPSQQRIADAINAYRERFRRVGMFENRLYPGIADALSTLRRAGYRLAVVTTKPGVYAGRIAGHFGIAHHFLHIHGSLLDGSRTGKTELIAHALEAGSVEARCAIMIGDREQDISGARANGLAAIGVTWGYGSREELLAAGADAVVDSASELVERLTSAR